MSYRNQQPVDYEPVVRRGHAPSRAQEEEFAAPPALEFPAPRFEVIKGDFDGETVGGKAAKDLTETRPPVRQRQAAPRAARTGKSDSWIARRGHTFSYAGIFLFTFILYFRPYELFPALSGFSSMALVAALLTLAIFVPTQVSLEGNLTARPREVNLLLLLAAAALLSIPFALAPGEAWATFNESFLKAVIMFIVMINVLRTEARLKGLIWISVGVGCLLSLNALDNYRAGNFTVEGYRVEGNLGGMFGNPNDLALHLVTMIPLAVALMMMARNIAVKMMYATFAVLMVSGTVVTFSRGGFLGLLFSGAVLAWKFGRGKRLTVMVLSIIVVATFIALAPGNYGLRLLSLFDSNLDAVGSSSARRELLIRSIIVALRNPLTGVGMGNFHIVSIREHVSHNAYTEVAAELGMAALAFYTLFIVTPLKRLWQIEKETFETRRQSRFYYLAVGIQASLVAYMVGSFFGSVAYQWYVYYLVAYAVGLRRIYEFEHGAEMTLDEQAASDKAKDSKGASAASGLGVKMERAAG